METFKEEKQCYVPKIVLISLPCESLSRVNVLMVLLDIGNYPENVIFSVVFLNVVFNPFKLGIFYQ